ncbi:MAG: DMT family transporter [Bdellovibrionaceae bacterium]|nr:DMT family transporter [Pseudobdellovibrionaceae bacterium]
MSFNTPTPRQAVIELVFAGAFWGFGFVAAQWALSTWNPPGVLFWRFFLALAIGEFLALLFKTGDKTSKNLQIDFKLAAPAGILLGTFLLCQTIGLQYTSASKSGFITTLYVIFIPAINFVLFKRKTSSLVLAMALLASFGTFLLMGLRLSNLLAEVNKGDLWTLACSVLAAFHIVYIGRITQKLKNPFRVNNFQSLWAAITVLPAAFFNLPLQHSPITTKALFGVLILAVAGSVLAFFIQVRAQKVLSDTTASVLFLLESPYAFFFAYMLIGDRLNLIQALGAILIVVAALGTILIEHNESTNKKQLK